MTARSSKRGRRRTSSAAPPMPVPARSSPACWRRADSLDPVAARLPCGPTAISSIVIPPRRGRLWLGSARRGKTESRTRSSRGEGAVAVRGQACEPTTSTSLPPMTPLPHLGEALSLNARLYPDRPGARDLSRAMTFRQWDERACRLANGLLGLGLAKGDRVAILAYNCVEWLEIYAATAKAGLVMVPVNFRLLGDDIAYIVEN